MHYLSRVGAAVVVAALAAAGGCVSPPAPVRSLALTPGEELAIGRAATPAIEVRFGGRLNLPAVQVYVSTVGQRVARSIGRETWPYRFTVLASAEPRLFSLPGGLVFVTWGLLEKLQSEAELAGLLGRQLAHLVRRHDEAEVRLPAQTLEDAARAAQDGGPLNDRQAFSIREVAAAWADVRYPPEMQAETDRLGLDYLVAAGYHPAEMIRLVAVLVQVEGSDAGGQRVSTVRRIVADKYPDRGGRVGQAEYQHEVLDRLRGE
jgi:beta-barrel assembly-enhancing protease